LPLGSSLQPSAHDPDHLSRLGRLLDVAVLSDENGSCVGKLTPEPCRALDHLGVIALGPALIKDDVAYVAVHQWHKYAAKNVTKDGGMSLRAWEITLQRTDLGWRVVKVMPGIS